MDPIDLHRQLEKLEEALTLALEHHEKQNESNAALHCSKKVMYSPLTVKLQSAKLVLDGLLDATDIPA